MKPLFPSSRSYRCSRPWLAALAASACAVSVLAAGGAPGVQAGSSVEPDYRIDHLDPETGIRLRGLKCGGVAGKWMLDFSGDLDGVMQVEGESVVELDAGGAGTFVTHTRTEVAEEIKGMVEIPPGRSHGRARLLAEPAHLRLEPVDSDAVVRWDTYSSDAKPTRVEIIPVQPGNHCN